MKKRYYTTGEFMKLTHVTKKTIRYYDEHNILKPSMVNEQGHRLYSDDDLARMQQILLLKFLGFSLSDIREMTINSTDYRHMAESLKMQLKLVEDRIEQLQLVAHTIIDTTAALEENRPVDWSQMRQLVDIAGMENSLRNQYQNASNISSRIHLHSLYSQNPQGWFPWVYEQCNICEGMRILELGCGDGSFWLQNMEHLPSNLTVVLSDISEGMMRDTRRNITSCQASCNNDTTFIYQTFSAEKIPYEADTFDLVIANHVLFYCDDILCACKEAARVRKTNGVFMASTYGMEHMKEVSNLVSDFDDRIILSANKLYERFGMENGASILSSFYENVTWLDYEDALVVSDAEPLISYILSCHGNQTQYILDRYKEFKAFVEHQVNDGFHITKKAGIFCCK